ncbi:MAG: DUF3208 family protein [Trueperaceae bacterium]
MNGPDEEDIAFTESEGLRDDRELWSGPSSGRRAVKLLQGYVWHPREQDLRLDETLPGSLANDVHLLLDALPQAPFAFFDDGTLSATQTVYQLTVLAILEGPVDPARMLPAVAEALQRHLDATPAGVGWQVMEDLREIG